MSNSKNPKDNNITVEETLNSFKKMYTSYMNISKIKHNKLIEFSVVDLHK